MYFLSPLPLQISQQLYYQLSEMQVELKLIESVDSYLLN